MRLFLAGLGSGMGGAYLLDDLFGADMRMYLAGTTFVTPGYISEGELCDSTWPEPQGDLDPLASRVNMLESFYYVQDWQTRNIHRFKRFLLDSGAFTAMYGAGMEAKSLPGYVGRYIDYINANDVTDFFEMDVDSVVGYDRVLEFRREIETQTGKRCIPVWHIERGKHEFQQMCHDYPYVAIGGIATRDGRKRLGPYLRWFVREAHRLGARVHGLGYTDLKNLAKVGFDSVDSTAWLYGNRGGYVYVFDGADMRKVEAPKGKKIDARETARHNFRTWVRYAERLEGSDDDW